MLNQYSCLEMLHHLLEEPLFILGRIYLHTVYLTILQAQYASIYIHIFMHVAHNYIIYYTSDRKRFLKQYLCHI